jgi:hypothetical protein
MKRFLTIILLALAGCGGAPFTEAPAAALETEDAGLDVARPKLAESALQGASEAGAPEAGAPEAGMAPVDPPDAGYEPGHDAAPQEAAAEAAPPTMPEAAPDVGVASCSIWQDCPPCGTEQACCGGHCGCIPSGQTFCVVGPVGTPSPCVGMAGPAGCPACSTGTPCCNPTDHPALACGCEANAVLGCL